MNRTVKTVLLISGGLLALCLVLGVAGFVAMREVSRVVAQTIDKGPAEVARAGDKIADYSLPAGFGEGYAVDLGGFAMVMHTAVDDSMHITLMQAPAIVALERDALEREMNLATGREQWTNAAVVDTQPCQIRGQETTLIISEGLNHEGERYRSASAVFAGNDGTALVNISGPAAHWDQEMVDSFIASLQ